MEMVISSRSRLPIDIMPTRADIREASVNTIRTESQGATHFDDARVVEGDRP